MRCLPRRLHQRRVHRQVDVGSQGVGNSPVAHGAGGVVLQALLEGLNRFVVVERVAEPETLVEVFLGRLRLRCDGPMQRPEIVVERGFTRARFTCRHTGWVLVLLSGQASGVGGAYHDKGHDKPGREQMLHGAGPPWVLSEFGWAISYVPLPGRATRVEGPIRRTNGTDLVDGAGGCAVIFAASWGCSSAGRAL